MKLTGNNRKGRHLLKNISNGDDSISGGGVGVMTAGGDKGRHLQKNVDKTNRRPVKVKKRWKKVVKISLLSVFCLIVAAVAVLAYDFFGDGAGFIFVPPPVNTVPRPNSPLTPVRPTSAPGEEIDDPADGVEDGDEDLVENIRDETMFTFLIFGVDEQANTDAIMFATFDTTNQALNVVSIPRDTMLNVSWDVKKANNVSYYMRQQHRGDPNQEEKAMQDTIKVFADILGFEVDYWVIISMRAFRTLVDAIGGVDYYVRNNMQYHDPSQNLRINYSVGMHRGLTGQQALEIMRFRGYNSADIGRIDTQQDFLLTAIKQILARRNSIPISSLVDVAFRHVRTNISLNHLGWLGREFLQNVDPENVNFVTMPGIYNDFAEHRSYVTILLDEWLEIVNSMLNPFSQDVTIDDVSILTRGEDRRLFVTDGNYAFDPSWGASSRGPSNPSTQAGPPVTSRPQTPAQQNPGTSTPANPGANPGSDQPDVGDTPGGGPDVPSGPPDSNPPGNVDDPSAPPQESPPQSPPPGEGGETSPPASGDPPETPGAGD